MSTFTRNLRRTKPNFNQSPWHTDLLSALDQIDEVVYSSLVAEETDVWANNTLYPVGRAALDTSVGSVFICLVEHTSPVGGTFLDERTAHSNYWTGLTAGVVPRGQWQHDTTYAYNDTVYDVSEGVMALCIVAHTSNHAGTIRDDSANWAFIFDFSTVGSSIALGVSVSPAGGISSSNVQDALEELDNEKVAKSANLSDLADASIARTNLSLALVAHSGSYGDLSSTPALGTAAALDVGTTANKVVQLDAAAKLPALDGSQLTNLGGGFAAGTAMIFQQTSAPTGWTKSTTHNDKLMRIVSGTVSSGGTNNFSTVMAQTAVGNTTLSTSTIPAHSHTFTDLLGNPCTATTATAYGEQGNPATIRTETTSSIGSGGAHAHSITMDIKYVDFIIATKN